MAETHHEPWHFERDVVFDTPFQSSMGECLSGSEADTSNSITHLSVGHIIDFKDVMGGGSEALESSGDLLMVIWPLHVSHLRRRTV